MTRGQDRGHQVTRQRLNIERDRKNIALGLVRLIGIIRKVIKGKVTQDLGVVHLTTNLEKGM